MVARYHGRSVSAQQIRNASGVPYGELSLLALSRAAEAIGLNALSLRLTPDDLDQLIQLPAIAHTQGQHYVVIERITSQIVYLSDPAYGRYALTKAQFQERWGDQGQGILLALEPASTFKHELVDDDPSPRKNVTLPALDRQLMGLALLKGLLLLVVLKLFSSIADLEGLPIASLAIIGGFCLVTWLSVVLLSAYGAARLKAACEDWISSLDRQNAACFIARTDLDGDVDGAFHRIAKGESRSFLLEQARSHLKGAGSGILTVVICAYLVWQYWFAGVLFLCCIVGVRLWMIWRKKHTLGYLVLQFERGLASQLQNWVRDMGQEWRVESTDYVTVQTEQESVMINRGGVYGLFALAWLLALAFSSIALEGHPFPLAGVALTGILGFMTLKNWVRGIEARMIEQMLLPGYEGLVMEPTAMRSGWLDDGLRLLAGKGEEDSDPEQILHFPGGAAVLVFGDDNAERTLVFHQLAGNVSGEDRQLATMQTVFDKTALFHWRDTRMAIRHASVLPLAPVGAIITGNSEYDGEEPELLAALEGSLLLDELSTWPDGLNTVLSYQPGRGHPLSQQVLVARALYHQPRWLIVDEVFRHLDPFREQVLLENLIHARQGLNTVIFSRRLEMTGLVDWIIHLRQGTLLEEGTLPDLIREEGYIYSLITSI